MARIALATAIADVAGRDPALARVIADVGPLHYPPRSPDGPFAVLARGIVFQQLAGRAAQAILGRLVTAAGGVLEPAEVARLSDDQLRAVGLSNAKIASLRDLADKVLSGDLDLASLARLDDDAAVAALTAVRGIGPWTAGLFLMFQLRRLDVWPVEDLGVRQGAALIWSIEPVPTSRELRPLGEPFRPFRTVVARYCWEALAASRGENTDLR